MQLLGIGGFENDVVYSCGNGSFSFEGILPGIVYTIVTIIKIGVPILLIIIGMIDLGKAVVAQKEEEIKKGQGLFIKRLISALLVFLVVFIVQLVVRFVASGDNANISQCINCFVSGKHTDTVMQPGSTPALNEKGCYGRGASEVIDN